MAKKASTWRKQYGPSELWQRVRPEESQEYLPNPHRGTATFQRFQGDPIYPGLRWRDTYGPMTFKPVGKSLRKNRKYIPWTTLSYCRWPWRYLETSPGKYQWSIIDGALKAAKARGQSLQVRFQPYTEERVSPEEKILSTRRPEGVSVDVPDWYWDTGARWLESDPHEPDHNDPRYLEHFGRFIRAFAERYDGHPVLESIDMAYGGFWGEEGGNCSKTTAHRLIDVYLKSFKRTQLVSLLGTDGSAYAQSRSTLPIGWRADCFGCLKKAKRGLGVPPHLAWNHMMDAYPEQIFETGVSESWKESPVTFETCHTVAAWKEMDYDIDFIIEQGYKYHCSVFMPKSVYIPEEWMDKMIEFDKKIGYRFVLRQMKLPLEVKAGEWMECSFYIDNVGCAPLYKNYKLAMRITQGRSKSIVVYKHNLKNWMPGIYYFKEKLRIPKSLKPGEVQIDLGIVNEKKEPVVQFAIKPKAKEGWHPLSRLVIL